MRILLGELFPEARPIELAQRVPLYELQTGGGNLAADRAPPTGIENVLPRLRRVGGGDLGRVIGDPGGIDAGPEKRASRRTQMVCLVSRSLRGDVVLVAALLQEIDSRRQVG